MRLSLGKRVARKAMQRLSRRNRPPAGGAVLAGKVVQFWREQPAILEPLCCSRLRPRRVGRRSTVGEDRTAT